MKKSFILTLRLFKKHLARFFTILAIVFVSVGFMSGVGEAENTLRIKSIEVYDEQNMSDLHLKSKKKTGFSAEEIVAKVSELIENKYRYYNYDEAEYLDIIESKL